MHVNNSKRTLATPMPSFASIILKKDAGATMINFYNVKLKEASLYEGY
jgi:hypothetical protein